MIIYFSRHAIRANTTVNPKEKLREARLDKDGIEQCV